MVHFLLDTNKLPLEIKKINSIRNLEKDSKTNLFVSFIQMEAQVNRLNISNKRTNKDFKKDLQKQLICLSSVYYAIYYN